MRFMTLYKPGKEATAPPSNELFAEMGKLIEEMAKAGVLLATDGLQPSSKGSIALKPSIRLATECLAKLAGTYQACRDA